MLDVKLYFFFSTKHVSTFFHCLNILIMLLNKWQKVLLYKIFYCEKSEKSENPDMKSCLD